MIKRMSDTECLEFSRLMESSLVTVWYNGRFSDGSPMWGAQEIAFFDGDEKFDDPFRLSDSSGYGDTPLAAVRSCFSKRPNKKVKK